MVQPGPSKVKFASAATNVPVSAVGLTIAGSINIMCFEPHKPSNENERIDELF